MQYRLLESMPARRLAIVTFVATILSRAGPLILRAENSSAAMLNSFVGWAKLKLLVEQATSADDEPTPSECPRSDWDRSLPPPAARVRAPLMHIAASKFH